MNPNRFKNQTKQQVTAHLGNPPKNDLKWGRTVHLISIDTHIVAGR